MILKGSTVEKIQRHWRAGKKKIDIDKRTFTIQRHPSNKNYLLVKPERGRMPIAVIEINRYAGMSEKVKNDIGVK